MTTKTVFRLLSGSFEVADDMSGWVITSQTAIPEDRDDLLLEKGDQIDINGRVYRESEWIAQL